MRDSPRRLVPFPSAAGRVAHDPVARLARLWKTFEETGTISAYIAYRMQLAHLARGGQMAVFRRSIELQ